MVDWKTLKKIDAHIHILPDDVHRANPDSEDVWVYAKLHEYRKKDGCPGSGKGGYYAVE